MQSAKLAVVAATGLSKDALHVFAAVGHWRWNAGVHDLVNTMFWPTVLCAGLRFGRGVFGPRP